MGSKNSPQAFRELVEKRSFRGEGGDSLSKITFFVGAGFSKSWDPASPTGCELFTLTQEFVENSATEVRDLLEQPGYPTLQETVPAKFKELVYNLNMQLKYPGIRTRYMDESSLVGALNQVTALVVSRFEEIADINYLTTETGRFPLPAQQTESQSRILDFFGWLRSQQDGSKGYAQGVHTDFISTNYDFVLETILDHTTPEGDSLRNTYRGVTPVRICGAPNRNLVHDHWSIVTHIKINGGFEILRATDGSYEFDYRKRSFADVCATPPEIMMPSREQNYTSHYFSAVFPKAVRLLQESQVLVLVGYSLSEEDALLRFLVRQFAEDPRDVHGKHIFYVDHAQEGNQRDKLQGCFKYLNQMDPSNIYTYSGSFGDWIGEVLTD